MSKIKRFLERLSNDMGHGGVIDDQVIDAAYGTLPQSNPKAEVPMLSHNIGEGDVCKNCGGNSGSAILCVPPTPKPEPAGIVKCDHCGQDFDSATTASINPLSQPFCEDCLDIYFASYDPRVDRES